MTARDYLVRNQYRGGLERLRLAISRNRSGCDPAREADELAGAFPVLRLVVPAPAPSNLTAADREQRTG